MENLNNKFVIMSNSSVDLAFYCLHDYVMY